MPLEVVVRPFTSYGRLAHVRRAFLAKRGVRSVKIARFAEGQAHFLVDLAPGVPPASMAIPGTSLGTVTASRIVLVVRRSSG